MKLLLTPDNRPTPSTTPADAPSAVPRDARPDLHLSQVLAGALAAVTSAVVGSTLGVAGTLAGAAVGSVVATSGGALYTYWFRRTGRRVRAVVVRTGDTVVLSQDEISEAPATELEAFGPPQPDASSTPPRRWRLAAALSVAAFILGVGTITAFEAFAGEPVSSLTTGSRDGGTSLGHALGSGSSGSTPPATTPTPSSTPTQSTPPATTSPPPSSTPPTSDPTPSTPTATTTPTPTDTPTDDPSDTPTPPPT